MSLETRLVHVGYRYIPPADMHTPMMYLPIQRTNLEVVMPCGVRHIKDALVLEYPHFDRVYLTIEDHQVHPKQEQHSNE